MLTASAVDGPREMVRRALFRNTLAKSPQMFLFDTNAPPPPPPGAPVYGIILHGPPPKDQDQRFPGFVNVAFPDSECRYYIESVNLMDRFNVDYGQLVLQLRRDRGLA